jgi:NADPH-dependent 2,4-dienoyl-CoA reductase/sulfur reductase-like enzyme
MTTQLEHRPASGGAPRVVVVGAGFGGLAAARRLARAGAETTLIDRNVYSTFQPLLYQLATGGLSGSDVAYPVRAASRRHGMLFRHGELARIDPAARQVTLADGATLGYDYLILATGVAAAYHGVPGAAEHSLGLYTRHDAIALRDRIMAQLDRISRTGLREDVVVTVIGGGATGVELVGSLADLRSNALPAYFPEIDPPGCTSRSLSTVPRCWRPSSRRCATTPAASWPRAASRSGSARPSPRSPLARSCSPTAAHLPAMSRSGPPGWRGPMRSAAGGCRRWPPAASSPAPTSG